MSAFLRLFRLLEMVPHAPSAITTTRLQEQLANEGIRLTPRTIQRNLRDALDNLHLPLVCLDSGGAYQWSWRRNARPRSLGSMDPRQALVLLTAEANLEGLMPDEQLRSLGPLFEEARQTLMRQQAMTGQRGWPQAVHVVPNHPALGPPTIRQGVQTALQDALILGRALRVEYEVGDTHWVELPVVNPIGFVYQAPFTYLAHTTEEEPAFGRLLALHRVRSVELLDVPAKTQDVRLIKELKSRMLGGFRDNGEIHLVARVDHEWMLRLREQPLHPLQQMETVAGSEGALVRADVRNTEQFRHTLAGMGESIEVLKPIHLRRWLELHHAKALQRYRPV